MFNCPPGLQIAYASILSLGGSFHFGYQIGVINPSQAAFRDLLNNSFQSHYGRYLTESEFRPLWSFTVSTLMIGAIVGACIMPCLSERFGRKRSLIGAALFYMATLVPSALAKQANSLELFAAGRFLNGLGAAALCGLQPLYLNEVAPREHRGFLNSFTGIAIEVGFFLSSVVGLPICLGNTSLWPFLYWVEIIPTVPMVILLFFLPDSPNYLLSKGDEEAARRAIEKLHESESVQDILNSSRAELQFAKHASGIKEIFKSKINIMATLIGCATNFSLSMCGVYAVAYYGTTIMRSSGFSEESAAYANCATSLSVLLGVMFGTPLMDRLGRRPIMLCSLISMIVLDVAMMVFLIFSNQSWASWATMIAAVVFMFVYGFGVAGIAWFITVEVSPQNIRGVAQSVATCVQYIFALIVGFAYYPVEQKIGGYSFLMFIIPLCVVTVFFVLRLPETKGRTVPEIMHAMGLSPKVKNDGATQHGTAEIAL